MSSDSLREFSSHRIPHLTSPHRLRLLGPLRFLANIHLIFPRSEPHICRKYARGFSAYERNTGSAHDLSRSALSESGSDLDLDSGAEEDSAPAPTSSSLLKRRRKGKKKVQKHGNQTGIVTLTDYSDILWYGSIQIGNPGVTYTVDIDTGASRVFLWLAWFQS